MAEEAAALGLLWAPSVGPGYDDSKIRPWNQGALRERLVARIRAEGLS
jgi:hypothetical protein